MSQSSITLQEVAAANIAKLRARYPHGFVLGVGRAMSLHLDLVENDNDLTKTYLVCPYPEDHRLAQLAIRPVPQVSFEVVDEFGDSVRGEGGFGSTGR